MASGDLNVNALVSHRFSIDDAASAYAVLSKEISLGIVIEYPDAAEKSIDRSVLLAPAGKSYDPATPVVAIVGAGNYASQVLIPAFSASGVRLATLVSAGGVSSVRAGKKFGFEHASTDVGVAIELVEAR